MRTIRKGNDINVKWFITRHGEAEDFTNKDVKVYLYDKFNNKQEFTYTINGNVVNGNFLGKDQITNGVYRLCLVENDGTTDMVTLDYIDCWLLCNKLKNKTANGSDTSTRVETEVVELTSVINTSGEIVNLDGYVTDEELNEKLDNIYNKSEVDQKLVDIATGGDIDLGAYAKKNEVYTKSEVDSALANVETIKGDKGDKGDPFRYEDFTQAQLASLKGEKGDKGDTGAKGDKGDAFTYNDFTVEQLESLKGEKGDPFTYNDFTVAQLAALKGEKGDQGEKGDKGDTGEVDTSNFYTKSEVDQKILEAETEGVDLSDYALKNEVYTKSEVDTAINNIEGQVGEDGKSAYEIAVDNGFIGTEQEWLASLKGTDGVKGEKGDAFTYADFTPAQLEALKGEPFTYEDFTPEQLAALKGEKGDKGDTGTVDTTNFYTKSEVDQKVADAASGGEIDLSGYAKTSDVYTKEQIDNFGYLTGEDAKATIYSKNEIDAFGFLTEHQSLKNYYTKNDVYSKTQIDNFAFLTGADAMATIYSKTDIDNMGFLKEHQSLANYYTKNEIQNDYYNKDDIDNFGYITATDAARTIYTKDEIDNKGYLTSHQSLDNYYTKGQVDTSLNNYYTKTQVDNFGFLTATDANNTIYSKDEIDNMGFLTEHQSLDNYYTKGDVDNTLDGYYTKSEIDEFAYLTSEDARKTIYSKTEIDNKGFLTQHQSLANYYTKDEIDEDFYDKEVIDNKFERVNAVPTKTSQLTNDSGYLTATDVYTKTQTYSKSEVDSLVGSSSSSGGGGFTVITNPSDSSKKGLVNSQSTNYDTNIGKGAVIEGSGYNSSFKIKASGDNSHAEGQFTRALGENSHAEGYGSQAYDFAHAEGNNSSATGNVSHAEGDSTQADGQYSHAEGYSTSATGKASHSEGKDTYAQGTYSHASGEGTIAKSRCETSVGSFNNYITSGSSSTTWNGDSAAYLLSVGNGEGSSKRHNAFEIMRNGLIKIADTDKIGQTYTREVNNNGQITTETGTYNYYDVPMINLQEKLSTLATSNQVQTIVDEKLAEFQESGGQVQPDWDYNESSSAFNYIKNKPVGKFKVSLVKEFSNIVLDKSNYNDNSYYYSPYYVDYNGNWDNPSYKYPSRTSVFLLLDSNDEILNVAPDWWNENVRYILEVDGKRVLCNSGNESNNGIRGNYTAEGFVKKYTCTLDASGNELSEPKDVYAIEFNFPEWLTQSPNVSSLKLYRVDETSSDYLYLTWYDINHVYFYNKEEVNNLLSPSDWNNNDTTNPQFIKNKPFGEFKVIKYTGNASGNWYHTTNGTPKTLNDGRYYTNPDYQNIYLKVGYFYYVYLDGKLYGTIEPIKYNNSQWITSNYDMSNYKPYLDYTGNNKVFGFGYDYGNSGYCNIGIIYDENDEVYKLNGASWKPTIEIYEVNPNGTENILIKLDSKFIDFDYNNYITDESISNKPFGNVVIYQSNTDYTNIFSDTVTFKLIDNVNNNHYGCTLNFTTAPSVGDTLELIFDGESKGTAEVVDTMERFEAGNGDDDGYGYRTNWLIYSEEESVGKYTWYLNVQGYANNTSHSVVVRKAVEGTPTAVHTIKTIDSRYVDTYTKSEIDNKIANVSSGGSVDLTNYYTKSEIDNKGYLTAHQDISGKANKSEVYTKTEIDNKGYLTSHQDISGKANSADVYTKTVADNTFATKAELPSIWTGTQAEYDAIVTKDSSTIYLIK